MKQLKNIKKKLKWEKYYDPDFNWHNELFYMNFIFSEEFIDEFKNKIDWEQLSILCIFSEKQLIKYKDKVDWYIAVGIQKINETIIRECLIDLNDSCKRSIFQSMFEFNKLSEAFLEELINIDPNEDFVDWYYISRYQTLSEDFIRKYKDKVYWKYILLNQKISEEFKNEFKDKIENINL